MANMSFLLLENEKEFDDLDCDGLIGLTSYLGYTSIIDHLYKGGVIKVR